MPQRRPYLSVVGTGTVGSALTAALHAAGYPVASLINRSGQSAIALARAVGGPRTSTQLADLGPRTGILLIAVSDSSLEPVVAGIAKLKHIKLQSMLVLHCSGVYPADVMKPLSKKGASIGAIHPIQTFPRSKNPEKLAAKLKGIFFGIDGDAAVLKTLTTMVTEIGGTPIVVSPALRPLYHAACVFASNYFVVFLDTIAGMAKQLNLSEPWTDVFGPLMTSTMQNVVRTSPAAALTGPVVRGDITTIRLHIETLRTYAPALLPLYRVNGLRLAQIARDGDRITDDCYDTLVDAFESSPASRPAGKDKR